MSSAVQHGRSYTEDDVELIFRCKRSRSNAEKLAEFLGRTPTAIDFVWRWIDEADFPNRAFNRIKRQVEQVRERLGQSARGTVVL
jgi:hypothetical protein